MGGERLTRPVFLCFVFGTDHDFSNVLCFICISGILGKADVLLDVREAPVLAVRGLGLTGSAAGEVSQSFSPSWLLSISNFVAVLREHFVLLFSCFKVCVSLCVQVDAEIWGINRCYLKKLIYGQLNNMPINPDLIGNQGTFFFLSAM